MFFKLFSEHLTFVLNL